MSFKGTDTTTIDLDAECVKIIDTLLEQTTVAGKAVEVGASLDVYFAAAKAGRQALSHDQLALLQELLTLATFTRAARPVAARAMKAIVAGVKSFYKPEG